MCLFENVPPSRMTDTLSELRACLLILAQPKQAFKADGGLDQTSNLGKCKLVKALHKGMSCLIVEHD